MCITAGSLTGNDVSDNLATNNPERPSMDASMSHDVSNFPARPSLATGVGSTPFDDSSLQLASLVSSPDFPTPGYPTPGFPTPEWTTSFSSVSPVCIPLAISATPPPGPAASTASPPFSYDGAYSDSSSSARSLKRTQKRPLYARKQAGAQITQPQQPFRCMYPKCKGKRIYPSALELR